MPCVLVLMLPVGADRRHRSAVLTRLSPVLSGTIRTPLTPQPLNEVGASEGRHAKEPVCVCVLACECVCVCVFACVHASRRYRLFSKHARRQHVQILGSWQLEAEGGAPHSARNSASTDVTTARTQCYQTTAVNLEKSLMISVSPVDPLMIETLKNPHAAKLLHATRPCPFIFLFLTYLLGGSLPSLFIYPGLS